MTLQSDGCLHLLDDSEIPGELYLEYLSEFELGDGETECLAVCEVKSDFAVCTDDRKARQVAQTLFGAERVMGSIRVLRWCVESGSIDCGTAFELLRGMKASGGFLPDVERQFFCAQTSHC